MAIDVKCPQCGTELEAPDDAAGKKVKCPDCGTRVVVPGAEDESAPPPKAAIQPPRERPAAERRARADKEEAVEDRPRRRRRDEDDEDEDERPRRRRGYEDDDGISTLIPYKNGKALAAYYCGVFSLILCVAPILGVIAFIFGLQGLRFAR